MASFVTSHTGACLLLVASFLAFASVLLRPDRVLAFNDGSIESALSPSFRFPEIVSRFWDNQFFFGQGNGVLLPTTQNLIELVLGPHRYRREGTWLGVWAVGLASYWAIRQFRRSRSAACVAALLLMLCGWTLTSASVGLLVRGTSITSAALSLGVLERNRTQGGWIGYVTAGGLLGLAVSDVADVGALLALCCGAYFLYAHWLIDLTRHDWHLKRLAALGVYVLSGVAVAFPMLQLVGRWGGGENIGVGGAGGECHCN